MAPLDPVLERVYRRGFALRRQRLMRRVTAAAVAVQLVFSLPLVARGADDDETLHVTAPATSTTTTDAPVVEPEPTSTTAAPTTTSTTARSTTTTTAAPLVCRNSRDPRCGAFRWEPDPGPNEPLTVDVVVSPGPHRVGEEITLTVTVRDPDAKYLGLWSWDYGDTQDAGGLGWTTHDEEYPEYCDDPARYGAWTPPPRRPLEQVEVDKHTYSSPGTYRIRYSYVSRTLKCAMGGTGDPYGSGGAGDVEVVVTP